MTWRYVWAAVDGDIDPVARRVLVAIAHHTNAEGHAWPSVATLALETAHHEGTVRKALGRLEAAGLVTVLRSPGRRTNEYVFDPLPQPAPPARVEPAPPTRVDDSPTRATGASTRASGATNLKNQLQSELSRISQLARDNPDHPAVKAALEGW